MHTATTMMAAEQTPSQAPSWRRSAYFFTEPGNSQSPGVVAMGFVSENGGEREQKSGALTNPNAAKRESAWLRQQATIINTSGKDRVNETEEEESETEEKSGMEEEKSGTTATWRLTEPTLFASLQQQLPSIPAFLDDAGENNEISMRRGDGATQEDDQGLGVRAPTLDALGQAVSNKTRSWRVPHPSDLQQQANSIDTTVKDRVGEVLDGARRFGFKLPWQVAQQQQYVSGRMSPLGVLLNSQTAIDEEQGRLSPNSESAGEQFGVSSNSDNSRAAQGFPHPRSSGRTDYFSDNNGNDAAQHLLVSATFDGSDIEGASRKEEVKANDQTKRERADDSALKDDASNEKTRPLETRSLLGPLSSTYGTTKEIVKPARDEHQIDMPGGLERIGDEKLNPLRVMESPNDSGNDQASAPTAVGRARIWKEMLQQSRPLIKSLMHIVEENEESLDLGLVLPCAPSDKEKVYKGI